MSKNKKEAEITCVNLNCNKKADLEIIVRQMELIADDISKVLKMYVLYNYS